MKEQEYRSAVNIIIVGLVISFVMFVLTLTCGFLVKSQAMVADAIHTLSDLFTDFVTLWGFRYLNIGKDEKHHYGHGKIETLSAIFIGALMIITGVLIAKEAVYGLYYKEAFKPSLAAIIVTFFNIVSKEVLFWFTKRIGEKVKSAVVIGKAWHHRSDAFSSYAVLIGVGAAYIKPEWASMDSYVALIVSFFIFWIAWKIAWNGVKEIVDTAPPQKVIEKIKEAALKVPGVRQASNIRARHSGNKIIVDFTIEVDPLITVMAGHAIATEVEVMVSSGIEDIMDVLVHVEPAKAY
ncbi:MAG: cation diffusion facilitator family transporter [Pseudomonadota bacterium]